MNRELLTPLNALEASLDSLVRSLTTTQTYAAGPKAARDLVKADDDLQIALNRLQIHQENFIKLQQLRAEADSLNARLKDAVLTAVNFRKELGEIHPSILEDSDDDDEGLEEEQTRPVDFETLLAFATRIGKHNAIAAQEAEKLVEQQYLEAKRSKDADKATSKPPLNGTYLTEEPSFTTTTQDPSQQPPSQIQSSTQQTTQVTTQISEFQNRRTWDRAQITMPFPNGEILRIGELGKLQIQREQNGEDYADGYIEMLVKRSELGTSDQEVGSGTVQAGDKPADTAGPIDEKRESTTTTMARQPAASGERRPPPQQQQERRAEPPPPKKTVNLDFPDDDDEDESDGD